MKLQYNLKKPALSLLLIMVLCSVNAQTGHTEDHHSDHKNEIGIANSPVFFIKEKEFAYGLHVHYVRNISETRFALGIGYERIFDVHRHNSIGVVCNYRLFDKLNFNVSPGIAFEDGKSDEVSFALHLETLYEFFINDVHIGPVLEFALDKEDYHVSLGVHIGFGF